MRSVHSDLAADGGAQPQRTMLAWNRTVLAAVVASSVVAFTAERQHQPVTAAVAALVAVAMVGLVLRGMRRWGTGSAHYRLMRQVVATAVLLAALGVSLAVRGMLS